MTTATREPTLDQLELATALIAENETETVPALSIQPSEWTDSSLARQTPMSANQPSQFFERLLTAIIASMGLAVYVAAPLTQSHASLSQPHPSANQSHGIVHLFKHHQSRLEQATANFISQSSEATSELSEEIDLYGQSQTPSKE